MNEIIIFAPRWRDKVVLIADWKIGMKNIIKITCRNTSGGLRYPEPFIVMGEVLKKYPIEQMSHGNMRKVPLQDLLDGLAK